MSAKHGAQLPNAAALGQEIFRRVLAVDESATGIEVELGFAMRNEKSFHMNPITAGAVGDSGWKSLRVLPSAGGSGWTYRG